MGSDWQVDDTRDTLSAMCAIEDFIFVGIYSEDRMLDYTKPGYETNARSLSEEIVPEVEKRMRIGTHPRHRSVWGSSLDISGPRCSCRPFGAKCQESEELCLQDQTLPHRLSNESKQEHRDPKEVQNS